MNNPVTKITNRVKKIQQKLADLKKLVEQAEKNKDVSPKKLELTT